MVTTTHDAVSASPVSTPYADMLPPLSTEEMGALRADIARHGVQYPVIVDEHGAVLDGHHRLQIDPNAPRRVIEGLSESEKMAFVLRANLTRRNLSPDQKRELRRTQKSVARRLRGEDPVRWTQQAIAEVLGVAQQTVSTWFDIPNTNIGNRNTRNDARVKVPPPARRTIADRIEQGESQAQVAADFAVTQGSVSKILSAERKAERARQERKAAMQRMEGRCGVIHGDFRVVGKEISDETIDLVFSDPPYHVPELYGHLAEFCVRVLAPGGWVLAYVGSHYLPFALAAMQQIDGVEYGWTYAVLHSGGDARFRNLRLWASWKPIIAFYRPPLCVTWEWHRDCVSGGKEKDLHPWQQAEAEAAYFIERMSSPGGIICDPMCGSGTTLAAAKGLGRRWIGCEAEIEHVETARVRVGAQQAAPDVGNPDVA